MSPKARFLVLDDEREVCNFFSYLLKNKGYEVETAVTGKEALEKLELFQFNVALVDLKLPDSDGLSILKIIKEKQPQCEVIIITGYSTVKSAVEAIQLGAFDYVEKPFVEKWFAKKALNACNWKLDGFQEEYGFVVEKPQNVRLVAASQKIAKNITVLIKEKQEREGSAFPIFMLSVTITTVLAAAAPSQKLTGKRTFWS